MGALTIPRDSIPIKRVFLKRRTLGELGYERSNALEKGRSPPPHTFNYEMSRREIYRGDNLVAPQSKLTL